MRCPSTIQDVMYGKVHHVMVGPAVPQGELDEVEPWYNTPFSREPFPEDWVTLWEAAVPGDSMHLPRPNPFIPHDFELVQVGSLRNPTVPGVAG